MSNTLASLNYPLPYCVVDILDLIKAYASIVYLFDVDSMAQQPSLTNTVGERRRMKVKDIRDSGFWIELLDLAGADGKYVPQTTILGHARLPPPHLSNLLANAKIEKQSFGDAAQGAKRAYDETEASKESEVPGEAIKQEL
jgi:hypothetical protein